MTPCADAQHRKLVLQVSPSPNGYRLAFASGVFWETVQEFATHEEARAAYQAAMDAKRWVMGFAR